MANVYTPRIEKMNSSKNMSAPTFARAGIVSIMVLNIILKNLAFLISLKTLPILKALTIVVCFGPTLAEDSYPIISVI